MARRDTVDQPPADPGLPFKRRARRRLLGALVIGLGVAVTLPLVLDREPRYPRPDIRVDIPSRDAQLPVRPPGEADASPAAGSRAPVNADSARAARAEAGRVAEARATAGGSAQADASQAATDARQQAREPMTQQLDVPADGSAQARSSAAARAEADAAAARAAAAKTEAARAEAQRQEAARAEAARANAARAEATRAEAARAEAARAEAARAEAARAKAAAQRTEAARASAEPPPRAYPSQNWAVQIGQFARPENARSAEARASSLGLRAYSETLQTAQGERVRVRAGPFATRAAAEEARSRLIAAGLEAALIAPEAGR